MVTENYLTRTSNFLAYSTLWGHTESEGENQDEQRILIDLSSLIPMVDNTEQLLAHLNMMLLGGNMSEPMQVILTQAFDETAGQEINARLSNLLFMIMISAQYTVQK